MSDKHHLRSRFEKNMDDLVRDYTASIPFDRRLYRQDIAGSIAHAKMLARQGIISDKDAELIVMGLVSIREEIEGGKLQFKAELEDIHMNIEARLAEKIGDVAGKLHSARSRNDQVALDLRLYARHAIAQTNASLKELQTALLDVAEANIDVALPGYTHLQRAQPVLLAHHFLAYLEMLQRDVERLKDCLKRTDVMPLGSGALAGVPYPIDRVSVAKELGFAEISRNSLDAVADRDFVVEYEAAAALTMMHLSRLAEELILWSSAEFGFVEMDDAYATGSSIMPQKKNPDVAELARGKTGRVYGHLVAMLTTLKGLPLAYNKDLQEDKEGFFDTVDTLNNTLRIFAAMVRTMTVNKERMLQAASDDVLLATDIADYLVRKGLPFREAHSVVASLTRHLIEKGMSFRGLTLEEYKAFSPLFDKDVFAITVASSLAARDVPGGTAPVRVKAALAEARERVAGH
ncbi:MAG: argininosuccinate lyase [Chloroflexi bacterium]|nr:argininosuccinate lyase [Chloroflexota bacterium]